jgi:DNA-directed RNA polymerase subunit RPC12/RpoP
MEVECLGCGKGFALPSYLDQEFEGEVRCPHCYSRLLISLKNEKVCRQSLVVKAEPKAAGAAELVTRLGKDGAMILATLVGAAVSLAKSGILGPGDKPKKTPSSQRKKR